MGIDNFLSNLGDVLSQQFFTGENKNKSAQLGSFANKYDRSAQRSYTEQGSFRSHFGDNVPKQLDILTQEPEATILVKKRAFASLAENFRPDLLDRDERLFLLATKTLFRNKAIQISNYEKLTKISQVSTAIGEVDYHILPIIFGAVDTLSAIGADINPDFKLIVDQVRNILAFNTDNKYTTWQTARTSVSSFGEGTGVLEFTTATEISTTTSLKFAGGRFSIRFADPYKLMRITNNDIEVAISDAANSLYGNKGFQLLQQVSQDTLDIQKRQLILERRSRGANSIIFMVEPNTFISKRIRAIIDVAGIEINFNADSISNFTGSAVIDPAVLIDNPNYNKDYGQEGLTDKEASLFNNIVSAMYNQLSLSINSRRRAHSDNQDQNNRLNDLRNKLRLHYAKKLIIQPMDSVSIFINSKKKLDSKITGGLQSSFSGLNFLQGISSLTQGIKDNLNAYNGFSVEKSIFVGKDFPTPLWLAMRNQFVADKQGACVFSGFTEEATSNYNNGSYEVNISGGDNAKFFEYGIVNIKPSMDVYNGPLYDPLTPFDLKYNSVSGVESGALTGEDPELLPENKQIFNSVFLKHNNGPLAGTVPTEEGYFNKINSNSKITPPITGKEARRDFYDPDGLVYRWKQGIASLVLFGDSYQPGITGAPTITEDPFGGQDIMNVLSLLITGEPYNYAAYYKAATQTGTLSKDSLTGQTTATSYFRSLRAGIKNKNAIYGDFIPFKLLTMDEASFERAMGGQLSAIKFDGELQSLTEKRASLADKLAFLSTDTSAVEGIKIELKKYDTAIQEKISNIQQELERTDNPPVKVLGNDISYDYTDFSLNSKTTPDVKTRKELRKKLHFLTRRLPWKVRGNQDSNLFIVDDTYDKDYDIQAFEQSYSDLSIFKSDYTTVSQQIMAAADKLKLEVFCNTQGHIEIRNKKYNRVPSSVFNKMLQQKDETGIQIFPQFLEDLFKTQLNDIYAQIEVIEDRIRLYSFALGKTDDETSVQFINSVGSGFGNSGGFNFLSTPDGKVNQSILTISTAADPSYLDGFAQQLFSQTNINTFGRIGRAKLIQSAVEPPNTGSSSQFKSLTEIKSLIGSSERFNQIKERLSAKTGETFNIDQEFGTNVNSAVKISSSNLATLQITNKIAQLLSDREQSIKIAANAFNNLSEGLSLDSKSGGNKLLFPSLSGNSKIPQSFEHMIEDESYDDLGVGSSKRYIIKNRDIISFQITEKKPSFTSVKVKGNLDLISPNSKLPTDLNVSGSNGNALTTAEAVDYDLWRMYGISIPQEVDAPFLHNPQTQLAPYAVSILNQARKEIFQGDLRIIGNEFQQPGEVVYVEDEDLLFYIDSVSHTFSYGKNFMTSMSVGYGHNPGEYIPTPLDVVGKVLYKNNKITTTLKHKRQGNVFNQENLGALAINFGETSTAAESVGDSIDIFTNRLSETNRTTLVEIINRAALSLSLSSNDLKSSLELRIYFNSKSQFSSVNANMAEYAEQIKNYLLGSNELEFSSPSTGAKKDNKRLMNFNNTKQVKVVAVDSSPDIVGEYRYPSRKAFYLAKLVAEKIAQAKELTQSTIDSSIYNHIIDVWINVENPKVK